MLESQYASGFIDFDTTNIPNSPFVRNIKELSDAVDRLGSVEYNLNILEPFNNTVDGNSRKVKIGKSTQGYYIEDLTGLEYPDGSIQYGAFGYNTIPNSLYVIDGMIPNRLKYYNTIDEALAPITEYILSQYTILLDAIEASENENINKINNLNNMY